MKLNQRIHAFVRLGDIFRISSKDLSENVKIKEDEKLVIKVQQLIETGKYSNPWFIDSFVQFSITQIGESLKFSNIQNWLQNQDKDMLENENAKSIAIIMAGNIPLVGFHDLLTVLISGNKAIIKESSKDPLIKKIVDILLLIEPKFADYIHFEDSKLQNFDAVIATGSNNTKRYFDYYFSSYPSIIRGHRNGIAVLLGNETDEELQNLSDDIFMYFGMGCRNVSKIFIPNEFPIHRLMKSFEKYRFILENSSKYFNNYEYYKSIYLVNRTPFLDAGFIMLKKDENIVSPLSVVYIEEYSENDELLDKLSKLDSQIQCIVSQSDIFSQIKLGKAQYPALNDYADGIDVLKFCIEVKKLTGKF